MILGKTLERLTDAFVEGKAWNVLLSVLLVSAACSSEDEGCYSDQSCPNGQVCVENVCVNYAFDSKSGKTFVDSCSSDLHCSDEQSCMFGQCIIRGQCVFGTKGGLLCETYKFETPCEDASALAAKNGYLWITGRRGKIYKTTQSGAVVDLVNAPTSWPVGLAQATEGFWYSDMGDKTLYKLTDGFEIVDKADLGFFPEGDIACDGTHAFVFDFDAGIIEVGLEQAPKHLGLVEDLFTHSGIAFDGNYLWISDWAWEFRKYTSAGKLKNVYNGDDDTENHSSYGDGDSRVLSADAMAWDGNVLWALNEGASEDPGGLVRRLVEIPLDADAVQLDMVEMAEPPTFGNGSGDLCWDGSFLWQASNAQMKLLRLGDDLEVLQSIDAPGASVWGIACDGERIWTVDYEEDTLFEFTHDGQLLSQFDVPGKASTGLSFDGEALWTVSFEPDNDKDNWNRVIRFTPSGKVLNSFYVSGQRFISAIESDGLFVWLIDGAWNPYLDPKQAKIGRLI